MSISPTDAVAEIALIETRVPAAMESCDISLSTGENVGLDDFGRRRSRGDCHGLTRAIEHLD